MTLSNGSSVVKTKHTEDEMSAMIVESREACKRSRKIGTIKMTVATHHLKELRHLRTVEKLATWRRTYGFERLEDGDDYWVHDPLPPTPEQTTASMWSDLKELKDAISMSGKERSSQRVRSFINKLDRGTASCTDVEFVMLKHIVEERRGCDAAQVTVAPMDTAQHCSPRSRSPEITFDARAYMKKNDEGRIARSEISSNHHRLVRVLKHPDSSVTRSGRQDKSLPRAVCSLAWVRNFGGNTFPPTERVIGTRSGSVTTTPVASSKTASLQTSRKPKYKKTASEENKQTDPGGKGEGPPPWKSGVSVLFSFSGGNSGPGCPLLVSRAFLLVTVCSRD